MKKKTEQFRQGDLFIKKVEKLPKKLKKKKDNIILYGEATGHAHRLEEGFVYEGKESVFIELKKSSRIVHDEHDPISLKKGYYEITRQREYTPEAIRNVID